MASGFSVLLWQYSVFCHDFHPQHRQELFSQTYFEGRRHLQSRQLIFFLYRHAGFNWFVDKWSAHPFLASSRAFCGWEVALKLFQKHRRVISLTQNPH